MPLPTLKPRLKVATTGLRIAPPAGATERQRGRKWMSRRARWLSAHPLCVACECEGRVTAAREVDHITPLSEGGADDESNFQSLCVDHHKAKTAREAKGRGGRIFGAF